MSCTVRNLGPNKLAPLFGCTLDLLSVRLLEQLYEPRWSRSKAGLFRHEHPAISSARSVETRYTDDVASVGSNVELVEEATFTADVAAWMSEVVVPTTLSPSSDNSRCRQVLASDRLLAFWSINIENEKFRLTPGSDTYVQLRLCAPPLSNLNLIGACI